MKGETFMLQRKFLIYLLYVAFNCLRAVFASTLHHNDVYTNNNISISHGLYPYSSIYLSTSSKIATYHHFPEVKQSYIFDQYRVREKIEHLSQKYKEELENVKFIPTFQRAAMVRMSSRNLLLDNTEVWNCRNSCSDNGLENPFLIQDLEENEEFEEDHDGAHSLETPIIQPSSLNNTSLPPEKETIETSDPIIAQEFINTIENVTTESSKNQSQESLPQSNKTAFSSKLVDLFKQRTAKLNLPKLSLAFMKQIFSAISDELKITSLLEDDIITTIETNVSEIESVNRGTNLTETDNLIEEMINAERENTTPIFYQEKVISSPIVKATPPPTIRYAAELRKIKELVDSSDLTANVEESNSNDTVTFNESLSCVIENQNVTLDDFSANAADFSADPTTLEEIVAFEGAERVEEDSQSMNLDSVKETEMADVDDQAGNRPLLGEEDREVFPLGSDPSLSFPEGLKAIETMDDTSSSETVAVEEEVEAKGKEPNELLPRDAAATGNFIEDVEEQQSAPSEIAIVPNEEKLVLREEEILPDNLQEEMQSRNIENLEVSQTDESNEEEEESEKGIENVSRIHPAETGLDLEEYPEEPQIISDFTELPEKSMGETHNSEEAEDELPLNNDVMKEEEEQQMRMAEEEPKAPTAFATITSIGSEVEEIEVIYEALLFNDTSSTIVDTVTHNLTSTLFTAEKAIETDTSMKELEVFLTKDTLSFASFVSRSYSSQEFIYLGFVGGFIGALVFIGLILSYLEMRKEIPQQFLQHFEQSVQRYFQQQDYPTLLDYVKRELPVALSYVNSPQHVTICAVKHIVAKAQILLGEIPAALEGLEELLKLYYLYGEDVYVAELLEDRGIAYQKVQRYPEAIAALHQALRIYSEEALSHQYSWTPLEAAASKTLVSSPRRDKSGLRSAGCQENPEDRERDRERFFQKDQTSELVLNSPERNRKTGGIERDRGGESSMTPLDDSYDHQTDATQTSTTTTVVNTVYIDQYHAPDSDQKYYVQDVYDSLFQQRQRQQAMESQSVAAGDEDFSPAMMIQLHESNMSSQTEALAGNIAAATTTNAAKHPPEESQSQYYRHRLEQDFFSQSDALISLKELEDLIDSSAVFAGSSSSVVTELYPAGLMTQDSSLDSSLLPTEELLSTATTTTTSPDQISSSALLSSERYRQFFLRIPYYRDLLSAPNESLIRVCKTLGDLYVATEQYQSAMIFYCNAYALLVAADFEPKSSVRLEIAQLIQRLKEMMDKSLLSSLLQQCQQLMNQPDIRKREAVEASTFIGTVLQEVSRRIEMNLSEFLPLEKEALPVSSSTAAHLPSYYDAYHL